MTLVILAAAQSGIDLQPAWIGLVGVLVGGLISGGFNLWVAGRKERADKAAEDRRHRVEVRRAARLIDDDLLVAQAAARTCVKGRKWWYTPELLGSNGWQQYREVIASELSESAWNAVMVAVMVIDQLQSSRDGADKLHRARMAIDPATRDVVAAAIAHDLDIFGAPPMSDDTPAQIEPMLRDLERGRAALASLTKDNA